jgi:ankyrin repeat protein
MANANTTMFALSVALGAIAYAATGATGTALASGATDGGSTTRPTDASRQEWPASEMPMRPVDGWLHDAVIKRDVTAAKAAIEAGADVNYKSGAGVPLDRAAINNDIAMLQFLLDHGARVEAPGCASLRAAAGHGSVEAAALLLDRGADVTAPSRFGATALHSAAQSGRPAATELEMVKLLIEHGADVKAADERSQTVLHVALRAGVAKLLVEHGADPNAPDNDGRTPLFDAASNLHLDVVAFLANHGADVNARDKRGRSALHEAAAECNVDGARALLAAGGNISAKDNDGRTPLDLARKFSVNGIVTGGMKLQTLQVLEEASRRAAKARRRKV